MKLAQKKLSNVIDGGWQDLKFRVKGETIKGDCECMCCVPLYLVGKSMLLLAIYQRLVNRKLEFIFCTSFEEISECDIRSKKRRRKNLCHVDDFYSFIFFLEYTKNGFNRKYNMIRVDSMVSSL